MSVALCGRSVAIHPEQTGFQAAFVVKSGCLGKQFAQSRLSVTHGCRRVVISLPAFANGNTMFSGIKNSFVRWTVDINHLIRDEFVDLEPHEYCVGAVVVIAIGFVLLSGRR